MKRLLVKRLTALALALLMMVGNFAGTLAETGAGEGGTISSRDAASVPAVTVKVNHCYNNSSSNVFRTETETYYGEQMVTVSQKDFGENVARYKTGSNIDVKNETKNNEDISYLVSKDQNNGTVTIDTSKFEDNTTIVVNFYYDACYTVKFRVDLSTATKTNPVGVASSFPHGDLVLEKVGNTLQPVADVIISANDLNNLQNMPWSRRTGYDEATNKNQYSEYGSDEKHSLNGATPGPGATIYKMYKLANSNSVLHIEFNRRYYNEFNAQFANGGGYWEDFKGGNWTVEAYFGEQLVITFPLTTANWYDPPTGAIGYYQDSSFGLWKYRAYKDDPIGESGEAAGVSAGTPLVLTGGLTYTGEDATNTQKYWFLMYKAQKLPQYTVSYFVDNVQQYTTETYIPRYNNNGDFVRVKDIPEELRDRFTEWQTVTFTDQNGQVSTSSSVTDLNQVSKVPGRDFAMVDRHIRYDIYTKSDIETTVEVRYESSNTWLGTVTHDRDVVGSKTGQTVLGSTAEPKPGYKFVGWYKDNTLVTTAATLTKEVAHSNLNHDGTLYQYTKYVAKFERQVEEAPELINITVTKDWKDNNNQDGKRLSSVGIVLTGGVSTGTATLSASNNWTHTFTGMPVSSNNGETFVYSVAENAETLALLKEKGYESSVSGNAADGFVITNSYEPETTTISVTKQWEDGENQDGKRPASITIRLLANEVEVASKVVTADNNWSWEFTNLPKYANGSVIEYEVIEEAVTGYTSSVSGSAANGFVITNSATTSVTVEKVWDDANNQDGKRPAELKVKLSNGTEVTLNENNRWTATVDNLPKYANGTEIAYTWTEVNVPEGYELSGSVTNGNVTTLTNKHTPAITSVTVQKVWDDANNQDDVRPASITINLLADGTVIKSQTLTAENQSTGDANKWEYTFTGLDVYKDKKAITYTVNEEPVTGYEQPVITGDATNGFAIKNTHKISTIKVEGTKTWEDNENQDGKRPASITINLLADGEKIKSATVSAENGWKWSFEDLPEYKAGAVGKKVNYTISEEAVAGYTAVVNGYNVTNIHAVEKVSVSGSKTWNDADDQDGLRPESITIKLLKNGVEADTTTATEENEWKWSFSDLNKYENGAEITYTIDEVAVPGYTTTGKELVWNAAKTEAAVTLINTHVPALTEISGTKTWNDADDQDGLRPDSITVKLLADGVEVASQTVTGESDAWAYEFTDLPVYADGVAIKYSVAEDKVEGYTATVNGFDLINTHTPSTMSVTVQKSWNDGNDQDGVRPASITINLLADGTVIKSQTLTAENQSTGDANKWEYTFTGLDVYKDKKVITYTVNEESVTGYEEPVITGDATNGFAIKNTHKISTIKVEGTKTWEDNENQDGKRPASITINLLADGEKIKSATVSAENGWKWSFEDLPEYKAGAVGKKVNYTISEETVAGYTAVVNGYNVTNVHDVEKVSISGSKTWDDGNDQDGVRPASITIRVLANGTEVDQAEVTADNNWSWEFTNLPKYAAGEEIEYTITEDKVPGYETEIDGYDVTNTHVPEEISISGTKTWDDLNNKYQTRPSSIVVKVMNGSAEVARQTVTANDEWKYTFANLPKYKNGNVVTYEISEEPVTGYTTQVDGYDLVNKASLPQMEVTKVANKTENVKLGEKIEYTIVVKNTGNVELKNIKVEDKLTRATWTVASLAPGASSDKLITTYEVTSADVAAGVIKNVVTATGKTPDPNKPEVTGTAEEEVTPEAVDVKLTVVKTSDVTEKAKVGDIIKYTIVVTNEGNVPYTNVHVFDELTGMSKHIPVLAVDEVKTFTTTLEVTDDHAEAGHILNVAVAKADPIRDPENPDTPKVPEGSGSVNDPVEPQPEEPTTPPTEKPTEAPTEKPTEAPTEKPTAAPTEEPTEAPTEKPTVAPTEKPTEKPTEAPTEKPTEAPTEKPTVAPTEKPTVAPTEKPTAAPTERPTPAPTEKPTEAPTEKPTEAPTEKPTLAPTEKPTVAPTEKPTEAPTEKPTAAPTEKPTVAPTEKPNPAPTEKPTAAPTEKPTVAPTEKPTAAPTAKPTEAPTEKPTPAPTEKPTEAPTEKPTVAPTEKPTEAPTEKPTVAPTEKPTAAPTERPTPAPTEKPTEAPTEKPTVAPTEKPTEASTEKPTVAPTEKPTEKPTAAPTEKPTEAPTEKPTVAPTEKPTEAPTEKPTEAPTEKPTEAPTAKPTAAPTEKPTAAPTEKPTEAPTEKPTEAPTEKPTEAPTEKPTVAPSEKPTATPTEKPTEAPTEKPTVAPTEKPTEAPTEKPTAAPTEKPTEAPTEKPTAAPTEKPTEAPTEKPTEAPTEKPTVAPTEKPTVAPSEKPTATPTEKPTVAPTEKPTAAPTEKPTATPTAKPTATPTAEPTATPTAEPTATPTAEPTAEPTAPPTAEPTAEPTATPTAEPTATPTAEPTATPTAEPTATPTAEPTATPTAEPTATPTAVPTATPTVEPTATPTAEPTATPTAEPTATPTAEPSATPTAEPTATPTAELTATPTVEPTPAPTAEPTAVPTAMPTPIPTSEPTAEPTEEPEEPVKYRVTVRYWYEYVGGEKAAKTFKQQYETGEAFNVTSPVVPGYQPDVKAVQGVMEEEDLVFDVIYTANDYTLTIYYIYANGTTAAPTYTEVLHAGDRYDVDSPEIWDYQPSLKKVKDVMPARDVTVTVIYTTKGRYTIIEDYQTPLGIGNVNLNAGECFE